MQSMSQVVSYLLGVERPGGGRLLRFGGVTFRIPVFPPNTAISFSVVPYWHTYCNIEFWHKYSPSMIPDAFTDEMDHAGIKLRIGPVGSVLLAEGHSTWVEITNQHPVTSTLTNVTAVAQFYENEDLFLIVDTEEDLKIVKYYVNSMAMWQSNEFLRELVIQARESNRVLSQILAPRIGGS